MRMRFFMILLTVVLLRAFPLAAQNRYTDSLYAIVDREGAADRDKIIPLSLLAHTVRYYDTTEAFRLAARALTLASAENDARYKAYAYVARASIYLKLRDVPQNIRDADSSLYFAGQTNDARTKAWAWYNKGRDLNMDNHEKEALAAFLKALAFIKTGNDPALQASIYYAIYTVFSTWEDFEKELHYAHLSLEAALQSRDPNNICESWQAIGSAVHDKYMKNGEKDPSLLDSTMNAYRRAVAVYLQNEPYMRMVQLITIPCINLADSYNRHFPASAQTTDSLRKYAMLAFNYATKDKDKRLQASAYGLMNEDAKRSGNFQLAETYLIQALSLFAGDPMPDYYIRSSIYHDLSDLAERRNDFAKALQYHKLYLADYKSVYDAEQSSAGKKLEAQYLAREKEQEIRFLRESETFHRRQKYLYIAIAAALLAGLLFMFRSYHFRLRYSLQRSQLLELEKEEARLHAKLKAEENRTLETGKRNAELNAQLQQEQAKLKAEEAARLQTEQAIILAQNEILQKEVMAGALQVEQKNKMLQLLKEKLEDHRSPDIKRTELNRLLHQQTRLDNDFEELKTDIKDVHPGFYQRLQQKAGHKLTDLDLKYCACIFLKRNTKEMASIMGIEPKSIRMSKYRIKQKLGLAKDEDLDAFVRNMA
ncbi:tetratricopeptide repeat protein [Chitinophaga caseinilytica]|uniref:tetratricopeptide repeat protein n=1 Tax=Chitinophaga caseinilytica TaxID=2267521 RepID=UPI003C2E9897